MKLFAETTGSFMLIDWMNRQEINFGRVHVVTAGQFVGNQINQQQLKVYPTQLPDEASDAEFEEWLKQCDGDPALAMASYAAKFQPEPVSEPAPPAPPSPAKPKPKATPPEVVPDPQS